MLNDEARQVIAAEFATWRAGITLPMLQSEVIARFNPLVIKMVRRYGLEALPELQRAAQNLLGPPPA